MLVHGLMVVLASFISPGAAWATWITWAARNEGECVSRQTVMSCHGFPAQGTGPVSSRSTSATSVHFPVPHLTKDARAPDAGDTDVLAIQLVPNKCLLVNEVAEDTGLQLAEQ